jgi:hypothetical protein
LLYVVVVVDAREREITYSVMLRSHYV